MAQIDALLAQMRSASIGRAFLQSDSATQFETAAGVSQGKILPAAQIEAMANEILAPAARAQLETGGQTVISHGGFEIFVSRTNGIWSLDVAPQIVAPPVAVQNSTPPVAPAPFQGAPALNNSGQGVAGPMPAEIQGFNWGAFLLPWIWAIGHSTWIGLLALIPGVNLVMRFVLGFKGNQWAWQNRQWPSVADFKKTQKTWALVSLILVVGGGILLIPLPAAILFPVFARASENAKRSSCQSNLKQIGLGVMQWGQDHNETYPLAASNEQFRDTLQPYVKSTEIFQCPGEASEGGLSDYQYNFKLSGVKWESLNDPSLMPLAWDKPGIEHLDGGNIAFADGHVKYFRKENFDAIVGPFSR